MGSGRLLWCVLVGLFVLSGARCVESINRPPLPPGASLDDAVAVMRRYSERIESIEAPDARLSIKRGRFQLPSLRTQVAIERPRNLRLLASFVGADQVDLGSNPEVFWFWVRYNSPPGVYYCQHEVFATSHLRQQLPVDLDWVLESLGLAPPPANERVLEFQPVGQGRLELRSARRGPNGQELVKLTHLDATMGWVIEQRLYDATSGTLLAQTKGRKHQKDPYTGSALPGEISLAWPSADLELTLSLGTIEFNQLKPNPQLFTIPQIPGAPYQNLSEVRLIE